VLVEALGHQLFGLRFHPGSDECRYVQTGVAVEHQLVVNHLVGDIGRELLLREKMARDLCALEREQRWHGQILSGRNRNLRVLECHALPLFVDRSATISAGERRLVPWRSGTSLETGLLSGL